MVIKIDVAKLAERVRVLVRAVVTWLWSALRALPAATVLTVRRHPRVAVAITIAVIAILLGLWSLAGSTAEMARTEELKFWAQASRLSLDERTRIANYTCRTGLMPDLIPWWEMDSDRCAATAWKAMNLFTGIRLAHGDNGAAWMLRGKNRDVLRTFWDVTSLYNEDSSLGSRREEVIETFREQMDHLDPNGVYLAGFRWQSTSVGSKIRRDKGDLNSHVVVIAQSRFIHMFRYGTHTNPVVVDMQERFFESGEMQPVWLARVTYADGRPFRFSSTKKELRLQQHRMPWRTLRIVLRIPDWVPGANVVERIALYWLRNGHEQYPTLP